MLKDAHRQRMAEQERAMARYEKALAASRRRVERARDQRDQARAGRQWLSWLRWVLAVRRERRAAPSPPVAATTQLSDREKIYKVGSDAERAAAAELGDALGDEWTLFAGYRNQRGEIDQLLLGPGGLIAIEVKYRNATVHCHGDDWSYEKFDRYNNLVERGPIEDGRGRSPSRQLNEPADALQRFLGTRGQQVAIGRVLVFTHPRSRVGTCRNPTVRVATDPRAVARWASGPQAPGPLSAERIAAIERLIVHDHAHHNTDHAHHNTDHAHHNTDHAHHNTDHAHHNKDHAHHNRPRTGQPPDRRNKPHPRQAGSRHNRRRRGR
jgi:Nuclease-related domain